MAILGNLSQLLGGVEGTAPTSQVCSPMSPFLPARISNVLCIDNLASNNNYLTYYKGAHEVLRKARRVPPHEPTTTAPRGGN